MDAVNCENIKEKYTKICVVEDIADQWSIENSNIFQGYFHILRWNDFICWTKKRRSSD